MRRLLRKLGASPSAPTVGAAGTGGRRPGPNPELVQARRKVRELRQERNDLKRQLRKARAAIREGVPELPERIEDVVTRVRAEHLTFLSAPNLRDLAALVLDLEKRGIPGSVIEAGTARGGSAIVMAAAKDPARPMKVYDVFGMIPPPSEHDGKDVHRRYATIAAGEAAGIGGDVYYGYRPDLLDEVTDSFRRLGVPPDEHHIELIAGLFQDTIDLDEPVALAHLDGDWYESTMTCLERIAPLISPGGRIVLDDYYAWSGCRTAVDEYFARRTDFTLEFRARVHAVRS
jgi:asparagine synthase (glutamine-hydrolysing)